MELWFTMEILWYYGQIYNTMGKKNYATIENTIVLYRKRFTKEKHERLPKTKKLWFIMEKKLWQYTKIIDDFEQT